MFTVGDSPIRFSRQGARVGLTYAVQFTISVDSKKIVAQFIF